MRWMRGPSRRGGKALFGGGPPRAARMPRRASFWLAGALGGAVLGWGTGALAGGMAPSQATLQTTVTVEGTALQVTYSSGTALAFDVGSCNPGNAYWTCFPSNTATLAITAPGQTQFSLSAYDTDYTDAAGATMSGSALYFAQCADNNCAFGGTAESLSTNPASPASVFGAATLTQGAASFVLGGAANRSFPIGVNIDIPSGTPSGSYSNTVTLIVTAS